MHIIFLFGLGWFGFPIFGVQGSLTYESPFNIIGKVDALFLSLDNFIMMVKW